MSRQQIEKVRNRLLSDKPLKRRDKVDLANVLFSVLDHLPEECEDCQGNGDCSECSGTSQVPCPDCGGTGDCPICEGDGYRG